MEQSALLHHSTLFPNRTSLVTRATNTTPNKLSNLVLNEHLEAALVPDSGLGNTFFLKKIFILLLN
jgi:hypothetical protein